MRKLVPNDVKPGDMLPGDFTEHFPQFAPYLLKLGMEATLPSVAAYAKARIEKLKSVLEPLTPDEASADVSGSLYEEASAPEQDHEKRRTKSELCTLTEFVASYHVS